MFYQCQVKGQYTDRCGVVVVFVASVLAISTDIVVGQEVVVRGIVIRRAVHIDRVQVAGIVLHTADLCEVAQRGVGG